MLVFLPGQDDIESLQLLLEENLPYITGKKGDQGNTNNILSKTIINEEKKESSHATTTTTTTTDTVPTTVTVTTETHTSYTVSVLNDYEILCLYAAMPPDEQLRVFSPPKPGVRRFILATNIAETSVTISGIKYGKIT